MNICVISREIYPYQKAGIAVYVYQLCRLLVQKGHQVYLITDNHLDIQEREEFEGIHIFPIQATNPILKEIFSNYNLCYSYLVFETLKSLSEIVDLDIVECSDYFGEGYFTLLEKRQCGFLPNTPVVLKCHTPLYECLLGDEELVNQNRDVIAQEDYCIQQASQLASVSQALSTQLKIRLSLTKPIQTLLNPLGVETVSPSRYQLGQPKTLLYVGRIQYLKGVDLLVKAAVSNLQKGHEFKVVLVGQDVQGYQAELEALIPNQYRHAFEFKGFMERKEVMDLYNQAYLSVFPSRWEGLSNVCAESIVQGCPVLTSDVGGLGGIHQYGHFGMKFQNENLTQLTDYLDRLLRDEELRMTYSDYCLLQGTRFLNERIYEDLIAFYEQAIQKQYQVKVIRQMNEVLYDNFGHSVQLNRELYQEVLRLNEVLVGMDHRLGDLYRQIEELSTQVKQEEPSQIEEIGEQ